MTRARAGARPLRRRDRDREPPRRGDSFDRAIAAFAENYAAQNERDYDSLQAALASGRIAVQTDL